MTFEEAELISKGITSGVTTAEARLLYKLAEAAHSADTGSVVEIGAYMGRSTIVLAATGLVYSIDHHRGNREHQPGQTRCRPGTVVEGRVDTFPVFRANLEKAGLWSVVVPVVTDHLTALSVLAPVAFPVAVLFVDAEHSYESTRSIIQTWVPHVRGTVLFHDYCPDFPDVIRAVDDSQLGCSQYRIDSLIGFEVNA